MTPRADLPIIKTANQTQDLLPGQNVTFTLTVTNYGPNIAHNVMVNDPIPTGIASFSTATSSQGSFDGATEYGT